MEYEDTTVDKADLTTAAVCGLFCEATTEDPVRLERLAARFQYSEEELKCLGCRSEKKSPYCKTKCKMFACAAERGVGFCSECADYPCDELKQFQAAIKNLLGLQARSARIVSCQPRRSFPCPSHFTSEGVAAVTSVLPLNAKMKRSPLMVVRSWGSLDITPESAL